MIDEREMLAVAFAGTGDDARTAAGAWLALADALGVDGIDLRQAGRATGERRTGGCCTRRARSSSWRRMAGRERRAIGVVGEVDPAVLGCLRARRRAPAGRAGWRSTSICCSTPRRAAAAVVAPVSRFPSSDVDLAFVVDDAVAAGEPSPPRCGRPVESCSSRWSSSTSTGGRGWPPGSGAWPTGCASAPSTAP